MQHRSFSFIHRSIGLILVAAVVCTFALPSQPVQAAVEFTAPGFVSEQVNLIQSIPPVTLNNLVSFAWAPTGDKLFLAHKSGRVTIATRNGDGSYQIRNLSFASIDYQTNNTSDRGLLSVTVDPEWPDRPYVYLLFVYDPPEIQANPAGQRDGPDGGGSRGSRLIRLEADSSLNRAVYSSGSTPRPVETVLLGSNSTFANIPDPAAVFSPTSPAACGNAGAYVTDCIPIDSRTHSIGHLQFDSDNNLWVSTGDGAEYSYVDPKALRSLSLDSLAGKILRIDPDTGLGLSSNPFYDGNSASNRSRVVNYGLRNPFRFTLHPTTDELFTGDVGWNVWEEINRGQAKNFGWPCYEGNNTGSLRQPGYESDSATSTTCAVLYGSPSSVTAPLYSYQQINSNGSGMVGTFYTGDTYPGRYKNTLFVFDYAINRIQYLTFSGPNGTGTITANDFATNLAPNGGAPVQLSRGPLDDTDLYYIVLNGPDSELRRIRYTGDNTPPNVVMNAAPTVGPAPLVVNFTSTGSSDADSDALVSYSWNFGDGSPTASGPTASHSYANGDYTAILTIIDARGGVSTAQQRISAGNDAPIVQITTPISGTSYRVDSDTIPFAGTFSDPNETLTTDQINWFAILHHDSHTHPDAPITVNSNKLGGSIAPEDHGDATWIELCATATDSRSVSTSQCIELRPRKVAYTFATEPTGLSITYEGIARTAPFTVQTNENALQQLIVAPVQSNYTFDDWFDGLGPLSRLSTYGVRIGSAPKTITARYIVTGTSGRYISLPLIQNP